MEDKRVANTKFKRFSAIDMGSSSTICTSIETHKSERLFNNTNHAPSMSTGGNQTATLISNSSSSVEARNLRLVALMAMYTHL